MRIAIVARKNRGIKGDDQAGRDFHRNPVSAAAIGLTIGANVKPQQIGLIFSIIVVPINFLGCVYYPWALLAKIRWLQIAGLFHPTIYMSEGRPAVLSRGMATPRTIDTH